MRQQGIRCPPMQRRGSISKRTAPPWECSIDRCMWLSGPGGLAGALCTGRTRTATAYPSVAVAIGNRPWRRWALLTHGKPQLGWTQADRSSDSVKEACHLKDRTKQEGKNSLLFCSYGCLLTQNTREFLPSCFVPTAADPKQEGIFALSCLVLSFRF